MPDAFPVQLVSPEHILFDGEAEMVVCRPVEGAIAFLNVGNADSARAKAKQLEEQ